MPPAFKRKLSSSARQVSPPPLQRRRLVSPNRSSDRFKNEVSEAKQNPATITFYSWNVNGINPLLQKQISFTSNALYPLRAFLKKHNWPSFLCLQEVKINRDDQATQRRVGVAANAGSQVGEPSYTTHFSLPRDRFNATGFGGKVHGVATLIRDDEITKDSVTSRPDWDLEGRVLVHESVGLPVVVINGYWVNGTSNPYRNPDTGEVDGTRHDHKLRFHARMVELCKSIEVRGKYVLLLGDMNVAPRRIDGHPNLRTTPVQHVYNRADFNAKFLDAEADNGFGGADVFRHFHGDAKKFTYHGRGRPWGENCDRVDLIIASRQMIDDGMISDTGICDTPEERGHSDHVPLWVSVHVSSPDRRSLIKETPAGP